MDYHEFFEKYENDSRIEFLKMVSLKNLLDGLCQETGLSYYQIGLLLKRSFLATRMGNIIHEYMPSYGYSRLCIQDDEPGGDHEPHWKVFSRFVDGMELGEFDDTVSINDVEVVHPVHWHFLREDARKLVTAAGLPIPSVIAELKPPAGPRQVRDTTYLNIIGGLCELLWREIRTSERDINQAEIIRRLEAQLPGVPGMSERNLKELIPKAIRSVRFPE